MCNAWNHHPNCTCGWGGDGHLGKGGAHGGRGPRIKVPSETIWRYHDNYCSPTTCPECDAEIFFIRHNGGSVWVNSLGWPWPKHPCMDKSTEPSWYGYFKKELPCSEEDGELFNGVVVWSMWVQGDNGEPSQIILAIDGGSQGRLAIAIKGTQTADYFKGKVIIINFYEGYIVSSTHDKFQIIELGADPERLGFEKGWAICPICNS